MSVLCAGTVVSASTGMRRGPTHPFGARLPLKRDREVADTTRVDAAERKEILNRYRDHSRRFEAAAARRSTRRHGSVIPFTPRPLARARTGADGARDRGSATRRRRPREPRDRRAPLPLGGDRQVTRPAPAREASGAKQSPRRSCWLPAWAHCVAKRGCRGRRRSGSPGRGMPGTQSNPRIRPG